MGIGFCYIGFMVSGTEGQSWRAFRKYGEIIFSLSCFEGILSTSMGLVAIYFEPFRAFQSLQVLFHTLFWHGTVATKQLCNKYNAKVGFMFPWVLSAVLA